VEENLCCVGILGWSENERMMDYSRWKKVGEDEGVVLFLYFFYRTE